MALMTEFAKAACKCCQKKITESGAVGCAFRCLGNEYCDEVMNIDIHFNAFEYSLKTFCSEQKFNFDNFNKDIQKVLWEDKNEKEAADFSMRPL